ncbi:MAG: ABC transporter permease, partial [Acidimicrobiales bacterium]
VDLTVLEGRLPVTAGEIAAGPLWLENRGLEVGDVVPAGNGSTAVSIVGEVLVPALDEDAVGGTVVVADRHDVATAQVTSALIELKPGVDRDRVIDDLRRDLPPGSITPRSVALTPTEVRNVGRTLGLIGVLAVFLGLIAVAAMAHALFATVRDRSQDLYVLRSLGFTPRQAGLTIAWMSITNTVLGLAVGIPLGVVAGSLVSRAVADAVGIATDVAIPWIGLALVAAGGLVLSVIVAAVPSWRATRVRRPRTD